MNVFLATFMVIAIIPAASYAWGMRGTTIGGEKGAMLPGALIGTVLALFSGIFIVQEHFYIFAALGAVAMYFGGSMTYGETLAFSIMNLSKSISTPTELCAFATRGAEGYLTDFFALRTAETSARNTPSCPQRRMRYSRAASRRALSA